MSPWRDSRPLRPCSTTSGVPAVVETDDRQPHGHRLGEHQAERLTRRGHGEHISGSHQRRQVVAATEQ